jgi:hypothetical protein
VDYPSCLGSKGGNMSNEVIRKMIMTEPSNKRKEVLKQIARDAGIDLDALMGETTDKEFYKECLKQRVDEFLTKLIKSVDGWKKTNPHIWKRGKLTKEPINLVDWASEKEFTEAIVKSIEDGCDKVKTALLKIITIYFTPPEEPIE